MPENIPRRPLASCRCGPRSLKNVSSRSLSPSVTTAVTIVPRRARIGRTVTDRTSARIVTFSPTGNADNAVSVPQESYRRG